MRFVIFRLGFIVDRCYLVLEFWFLELVFCDFYLSLITSLALAVTDMSANCPAKYL